jgi:hypothetical protein
LIAEELYPVVRMKGEREGRKGGMHAVLEKDSTHITIANLLECKTKLLVN